jgi:hypothetical protein
MTGTLAQDILFRGQLDLDKHGIDYRAGKSRKDVDKAMSRLQKDANGRLLPDEFELFEVLLKGIFKAVETA